MIHLTLYTQRPDEDVVPRRMTINPDVIMFYYRETSTKKIPIIGQEDNFIDYTLVRVNEGVNLNVQETPEQIDALLSGS